ncbi:MAG TPA: hypothetical protein VF549_08185 [Solirubrobacteraceae bacterium]|jgi:hypothetical protein
MRDLVMLHIAEAQLMRGSRADAKRLVNRAVARGVIGGESQEKLALLRYLLEPDDATRAKLDRVLTAVREREVTVFVDLCVTLARLGRGPDGMQPHLRDALRLLRAWGNDALASQIRAALPRRAP